MVQYAEGPDGPVGRPYFLGKQGGGAPSAEATNPEGSESPVGLSTKDLVEALIRRLLPLSLVSSVSSILSGASKIIARPGRPDTSFLDALGDVVDVRQFGAKDDNATDNTAAFQAAVDAASSKGRSVFIAPSSAGSGAFRIGAVNWRKANIAADEGVSLLNLDGTRYQGGYTSAPGSEGLIGLVNPGFYATGRRVISPTGDAIGFSRPGDRDATFCVWSGHTGNPYLSFQSERDAFLYGQAKETSGSVLMDGKFLTLFNATNGPGLDIQCMATNGSPVLTMCSPSPAGTHTFTLDDGSLAEIPGQGTAQPNIFSPCAILGPGIPPNSWAKSWDATTITLGKAGTYDQTVNYTGPTGPVTIRAVSGFSEFNFISWHMDTIGRTGEGGPQGGLKFYNDVFAPTNASANPDDQEGYQNGLQIIAYKQVPGLLLDPRHNGSYPLVVIHVPTGGQRTYTGHASAALTGYAGNPGLSGGQDPTAEAAALVALKIGGPLAGSYGAASQRSFYKTGVTIEDYDTAAISIGNPRRVGPFSGTAINVDPEAGNIVVGDSVVIGKHIASNGVAPTIGSGGTLDAGSTDAHGTVSCLAGSTGFTVTWARPYGDVPDVLVSSPTNTPCFYTPTAQGVVFGFGALAGPAKFTYHVMGI